LFAGVLLKRPAPVNPVEDSKPDSNFKVNLSAKKLMDSDSTESKAKKSTQKQGEPLLEQVKSSKAVGDPLSNIHSYSELEEFLTAETALRKVNRKSAWSRRLDQTAWKELCKKVRTSFNFKTPNKSIKLSRKLLREGIVK
jgi:hypothetical protein